MRTYPGQKAFLLGNELLRAELERMGLVIDNEHPDYVLIGYDTTLDYEKMTKVCDLVRAGLPYVATHPDFNCPTETASRRISGPLSLLSRPARGEGRM